MDLPPRCYSCNKDIGSLYLPFKKYMEEIIRVHKENTTKDKDYIYGTTIYDTSIEKIFENLNINNVCCRKHMITPYPFWDAYKGYDIDKVQDEPKFLNKS